jgi:hypothetical protein
MTTTTNRYGENITVGQKCIITKQFSNMKIETTDQLALYMQTDKNSVLII